jgi:hypothetical protein
MLHPFYVQRSPEEENSSTPQLCKKELPSALKWSEGGGRGGGLTVKSQVYEALLRIFTVQRYRSASVREVIRKKNSFHQSTAVPAGLVFGNLSGLEKGEFRLWLVINPCKSFIFFVPCPGRAGSVFYSFYSLFNPNSATDDDGRLELQT